MVGPVVWLIFFVVKMELFVVGGLRGCFLVRLFVGHVTPEEVLAEGTLLGAVQPFGVHERKHQCQRFQRNLLHVELTIKSDLNWLAVSNLIGLFVSI